MTVHRYASEVSKGLYACVTGEKENRPNMAPTVKAHFFSIFTLILLAGRSHYAGKIIAVAQVIVTFLSYGYFNLRL